MINNELRVIQYTNLQNFKSFKIHFPKTSTGLRFAQHLRLYNIRKRNENVAESNFQKKSKFQ